MLKLAEEKPNHRILIVDDNPAIHDDFRKVLAPAVAASAVDQMEAELFGEPIKRPQGPSFELSSAMQGQEALAKVQASKDEGQPYAMAFVDIRMPPGWDGVETALQLWAADPDLQIVICSAYSDYSWEQMTAKLGARQQLLILKKPFDTVEVLQLAHALTDKWQLLKASRRTLEELDGAVKARTQELEKTHAQLLEEVERREAAEIKLVHAQKLQALSRLAGGLAHEINNPLSFVTCNLQFIDELVQELQAPVELSKELAQASADAMQGAERIRRIVRDVKIFDQADSVPPREIDMGSVVTKVIAAQQPALSARGSIVFDGAPATTVWGSEEGIFQVLSNVVQNAVQALPERDPALNRVEIGIHAEEQGGVTIEVKDNGVGIAPEVLPRIFEPFFTTRGVGAGTGLGLSICHGIVTKLGGEIRVSSQLGEGTMVRIALRAHEGPSDASHFVARLPALPGKAMSRVA